MINDDCIKIINGHVYIIKDNKISEVYKKGSTKQGKKKLATPLSNWR